MTILPTLFKPTAWAIFAISLACVFLPADRLLADPALPEPVEPCAAVSTVVVPEGFRVELVAAEPLVRDPVALEFDENAAAYVIELPPYNEHAKPGQKTNGSICRLEDTNGDGRFDRRFTFADDLNYPTGLFCYDGGLFVGDPPDLLYLRDTNGDGRADQREVVLTGFGTAPAGESQLNSFRWGLDNRIHISTGLDGGEVRPVQRGRVSFSRGGVDQRETPAVENETRPPSARDVRNRRVLLDPRTRTFELTSGGGQHGMSFDDWGRTYVCDNSRPIEVILYDDRYLERNPLMSAPGATVRIGPGANFTKLARISPPETWRRIRTHILSEGATVDDTFEAGRVSGIFTSATGITIYRGDAWPEKFRGNAFVGEVANNLVYRARLTTAGLSTTSERVDLETEFMASSDTWFRPVQFAHGPDGNLYVLDMYRELIEGVQWLPPEVLARLDPTAGTERGRIYRIVPDTFQQPPRARLGEMPTEALVELLAHANSWHRETAARLLYQRQDQTAIRPLRRLLADSTFPQGRRHAMSALDGLGALEAADVLHGLADEHPRVREHAMRLAEPFAADVVAGLPTEPRRVGSGDPRTTSGDAVRQKLVDAIADPDAGVRFQLAFSLGCLPPAQRDPALVELLRSDGADSWFRMAIQSSLGGGGAEMIQCVLADSALRHTSHGQAFLAALAKQVGRGKNSDEVRTVMAALDAVEDDDGAAAASAKNIVVALLDDGAGVGTEELMKHSQGRAGEIVAHLFATARATALDQNEPAESRLEAIGILGCGDFPAERQAFDELLAPQQPQPIQEAVLRILGRFSDLAVVELLLTKWSALTPGLRASAVEVLLSRPAWAESLLAAIEREEVAPGELDPARVALLQSHPSASIRERAAAVFSDSSIARRADVVARYSHTLELTGDIDRGRAVFQKSCAACHELEGSGAAIGADLRAIRDRGPDGVLLAILDPNREVQPRFLTYLVATSDGRTITGMITEETPNNLTIRQADGTAVAIARPDIDEMQSTGMSYMPEGMENEIDQQAMADLLAYLMAGSGERGAGSGDERGDGK